MSSPTAAAVNHVLLVGDSQVGKHYLLKHILSTSAAPSLSSPSSPQADGGSLWYVDTKYYSACVVLHSLAHKAAAVDRQQQINDQVIQHFVVDKEIQALILVFDLHRPSSFDAFRDYEHLLSGEEQVPPAVLLCVGVISNDALPQSATAAQVKALEEKARDWALDHGLEYIQVPFEDTAECKFAADVPLSERETRGISRVVESLQCNMWSNCQMKDKKKLKYMQNVKLDEETEVEEKKSTSDDSAQQKLAEQEEFLAEMQAIQEQLEKQQKENAQQQSVSSTTSSTTTAQAVIQNAQLSTEEIMSHTGDHDDTSVDELQAEMDKDELERKFEKEMESMEALMERFMLVKNEMKRSGNSTDLTDDDRRKRAEEMIFALMKGVGLDGDFDDGEDEDDAEAERAFLEAQEDDLDD